jgi:hypothetical protein
MIFLVLFLLNKSKVKTLKPTESSMPKDFEKFILLGNAIVGKTLNTLS